LIDHTLLIGYISVIEDDTDPIRGQTHLSKYPDLHECYGRLFRFIFGNPCEPNHPTRQRLVTELRHLAKAWISFQLFELNREYLSDPRKIVQEFNHFSQRKEVLPDDIAWAYRRSSDLHPSFVLEIPTF
jgi:hypothetical protein